jgi:capsular polysaccharide transport system permease protein
MIVPGERAKTLVDHVVDRDELRQFVSSLIVMARVVYALILRESRTRYGKSDLGYTWALIDPMLELIALLIVFYGLGRIMPFDGSLAVFLVTGIVPYKFWSGAMGRGASAANGNIALLSYPQVKIVDVVIARTLLEGVTNVVVIILFVAGLHVLFDEPLNSWTDDGFNIVAAILAIFYFSLSCAVLSSSITLFFDPWQQIWRFLSRPIWFISGIFYTMDSVGVTGFRHFTLNNPVAHMIEWLRSAMMPQFDSHLYSPSLILVSATCILGLGLLLDRLATLTGKDGS